MSGGGCCWSIAFVGAMSENGSCCNFSRMSSGGRIVAIYDESSSRFGTLDGKLRSLGSSEMVNCACSEWVISRSCEGIGMKPNLHVG